MRYFNLLCTLLLVGVLHGCMTIEAVSVSQIPAEKDRHNRVEAKAGSPVIFAIPFGSSYPEEARRRLLEKCPGGAIEGVLAKFQNIDYFLFVSYKEVVMSGYCLTTAKKG